MEVTVQGKAEKIPIEVEIAERQYSSKEVLEVFDRIISRMDELILGENKSLDRIEQDMVLLTKIPSLFKTLSGSFTSLLVRHSFSCLDTAG